MNPLPAPGWSLKCKMGKVEKAVDRFGYCCIYGLLTRTAHMPASQLADELGVDHSSILYFRRRLARGQIICLRLPGCSPALEETDP